MLHPTTDPTLPLRAALAALYGLDPEGHDAHLLAENCRKLMAKLLELQRSESGYGTLYAEIADRKIRMIKPAPETRY